MHPIPHLQHHIKKQKHKNTENMYFQYCIYIILRSNFAILIHQILLILHAWYSNQEYQLKSISFIVLYNPLTIIHTPYAGSLKYVLGDIKTSSRCYSQNFLCNSLMCSSNLSWGGIHSLIRGIPRKSWNQESSKGMVSASISFMPMISPVIWAQHPSQPAAISHKAYCFTTKKALPLKTTFKNLEILMSFFDSSLLFLPLFGKCSHQCWHTLKRVDWLMFLEFE